MKRLFYLAPMFLGLAFLSLPAWAEPAVDGVTGIYQEKLNRAPDPAGLQFWVKQARMGKPLAQIEIQMARSPEAASDIQNIYQTYLGRQPSASELSLWQNQLAKRGQTLAGITAELQNSPEAKAYAQSKVKTPAPPAAPPAAHPAAPAPPPALVTAPDTGCTANYVSCLSSNEGADSLNVCSSQWIQCTQTTTAGLLSPQ